MDRLSKDELEYELEIRGVSQVMNVQEMRKKLRSFLKLEKEEKIKRPEISIRDAKQELDNIEIKLGEVIELQKEGDSTNLNKIDTKFSHLYSRINRIQTSDADLGERKFQLLQKVMDAWTSTKTSGSETEHSGYETAKTTIATDKDRTSESEQKEGPSSITPRKVIRRKRVTFKKNDNDATSSESDDDCQKNIVIKKSSVHVKDWGLKFSGDGEGLSVNALLENIDVLRRARNNSSRDLFRQAIDLFSGPALAWFKSIRRDVESWPELVKLLKEEFEPEDYEDRLWDEIRQRTQGREEKAGTYIAIMRNYFSRLSNRPSESVMLKTIRRNLNPFFQEKLALQPTESIEQLRHLCHQIETCRERVDSYRPPEHRKNYLERDLAYESPKLGTEPPKKTINSRCWNCQRLGHRFSSCPDKIKTFCHRCGEPNQTAKTCVKCMGNERQRQK